MTQTIIINTDERPLKEKHVAFYATKNDNEITICEVVEATYQYPDAPATLSRLESRRGKTMKLTDPGSAAIQLVNFANLNMEDIRRRYFTENI